MVVDLTPEQESLIEYAVESGLYRNTNEAFVQALEFLREQLDVEVWLRRDREAVAAKISRGFEQSQRGLAVDGDVALEMLRKRRATSFDERR